jgi:hypothetical protein
VRLLRRAAAITIGIVFLVAGYVATSVWRAEAHARRPSVPTSSSTKALAATAPSVPFVNGRYLVAYVLFASDCGFSQLPGSKEALARLRSTLAKSHGGSFAAVKVVGVDLDTDLKPGLQFISELEHGSSTPVFDQLSVGGSWLNDEFLRIGWRGGLAKSSIPQVLLVARSVDSREYASKSLLSVGPDSVVADIVGAKDIVTWVAGGTGFSPRHATSDPPARQH